MRPISKEFQGIEYIFDFSKKEDVQREKPTVIILLKKTEHKNKFEVTGVHIFQNPFSEFTFNPKLPEVQRADYALLLRYNNHQDTDRDQKILKALGDILYSNFNWDRIVTLDDEQF